MDPEHPCTFLWGVQGIQDPEHPLPGPFLRAVYAVSNLEGWGYTSPQRAGLLPLTIKATDPSVFLSHNATHHMCRHSSSPTAWPHGAREWSRGTRHEPEPQATAFALSYKVVLCLWPRSFVSSLSIHETLTGSLGSL